MTRIRLQVFARAFALSLATGGCSREHADPAEIDVSPRVAGARAPDPVQRAIAREARPMEPGKRVLRVCADPNNLPFSNAREEGFENELARLLARELDATLEYTWWVQHRGFFRNTINAKRCDLVMGVPTRLEMVATTAPLYRSSYVFVTRAGEAPPPRSFDDPFLRHAKVGVHLIGDDYTNTPPVHALGHRGIISNLVGYRVTDDYSKENPPARLVEAVANGAVDVAIVWGPLAGYFAPRQPVPLVLRPIPRDEQSPWLTMTYEIALGVRREDTTFKAELERILIANRAEIREVLTRFHVPIVEG